MALSLLQLRDGAKDRADLAGVGKPTDTRWNSFVNYGIERLYRIVKRAHPDLFHTTQDFTLTGTTSSTVLPATLRSLRGVTKDPDNISLRVSLRKWSFSERDDVSRGVASVAGAYRMYYVVGPTVLVAGVDQGASSFIDPVLEPYGAYVELCAAIDGLDQEESDSNALRARLVDEREEIEWDIAGRDDAEPETIADVEDGGRVLIATASALASSTRVPSYRILGGNLVIR